LKYTWQLVVENESMCLPVARLRKGYCRSETVTLPFMAWVE
jgi:hypothetical protein